MTGPLAGVRVIELAGLGPGPFAAMMLADLGAEVIRVDRAGAARGGNPDAPPADVLNRGRRSVGLDLKHPDGVETLLRLIDSADALIEGFRPGVCERLGVGPEVCMARNPTLVYGRVTGWGQDGPLAQQAGHDINYVALSGTLSMIGRKGQGPVPPVNLVGDAGGGGMLLAVGVLAGIVSARSSGVGQVVDAAMVDGAALLGSMIYGLGAMGLWGGERGSNLLDTGAHFYDVYETADGKYISLGAIESQFYVEMLERLDICEHELADQYDSKQWDANRAVIARRVLERTQGEWDAAFEGSDACYAPVLDMTQAREHPHIDERGTFVEIAGVVQPAPAPRFSQTPTSIPVPPAHAGQHTSAVLADFGFSDEEVATLRDSGAVA